MALDARIPLMVQPVRSDLDRQRSLADLAAQQQQTDLQRQQFEQQQRASEQAAHREQAAMIAKLTANVTDEATYQQRLQAARAYGIDVSQAPANYDPNWVQTQNILAETFLREGPEGLSTTAQELVEAGLKFGTPEFQQAMAQRLAMKDSKVITTQAGGAAGMLGPGGYQPIIAPNDGSQQFGQPVSGGEERKTVGGRSFVKRNGQWFEETGASNGASGFPASQ